jgi:hypothetical protein
VRADYEVELSEEEIDLLQTRRSRTRKSRVNGSVPAIWYDLRNPG